MSDLNYTDHYKAILSNFPKQTVSFKIATASAYNPETGGIDETKVKTYSADCVVSRYRSEEILSAGGTITINDKKLLFSADNYPKGIDDVFDVYIGNLKHSMISRKIDVGNGLIIVQARL